MTGLLVDENLPSTLPFPPNLRVIHATDLGSRPTDDELWREARRLDCVILTKDADFFDRLLLDGPPPKVVWLRTGNMRRKEIEHLVETVWDRVVETLSHADLVEIHHDRIEGITFEATS